MKVARNIAEEPVGFLYIRRVLVYPSSIVGHRTRVVAAEAVVPLWEMRASTTGRRDTGLAASRYDGLVNTQQMYLAPVKMGG